MNIGVAARHTSTLGMVTGLIAGLSWSVSAAAPPSPLQIIQTHVVLEGVTISAPFSELFAKTRARLKEYEEFLDPDASEDLPDVGGVLEYADANGKTVQFTKVRLSVRGNTSRAREECPFPKLTI